MKPGQRVTHPVYGVGTILGVEDSRKLGDGPGGWPRSSSVFYASNGTTDEARHITTAHSKGIWQSNGASRYTGSLNIYVKFDNGGPQGFADNSTNDVNSLQVI